MKISKATASCMALPTRMPACRFRRFAVSGQAATPENIANQPFVMGSGPWCDLPLDIRANHSWKAARLGTR